MPKLMEGARREKNLRKLLAQAAEAIKEVSASLERSIQNHDAIEKVADRSDYEALCDTFPKLEDAVFVMDDAACDWDNLSSALDDMLDAARSMQRDAPKLAKAAALCVDVAKHHPKPIKSPVPPLKEIAKKAGVSQRDVIKAVLKGKK